MATAKKTKSVDRNALGSAPSSWNWFAGGPLRGCKLMREKQRVVAWDDGNSIYLFDAFGDLIADARIDKEIIEVSAGDDGEAITAVTRSGELWWFDRELNPAFRVQNAFDALGAAVDPHSCYVAVAGVGGQVVIYGRDGRKYHAFETRPAVKRLAFTTDGQIVGCSDHGLLGMYDLQGRIYWESKPWSNVGGMAVDGRGEAILLACYGHGLVRFNGEGVKEGAYRMDCSPSLVAIDYFGRKIVCASLEQTLVELTFDGTITGSRSLPDEPVAVSMDALGRYAVVAMKQGELRFFTLDSFFRSKGGDNENAAMDSSTKEPTWAVRAADSAEDVDAIVLEPVPGEGKGSVAVYTRKKVVTIIDAEGKPKHQTDAVSGVGRSLWSNDRWLVASSDGNLTAYDPADNTSVRCTLPMFEISHVELLDEFGSFILVQSCEYVTRVKLPVGATTDGALGRIPPSMG